MRLIRANQPFGGLTRGTVSTLKRLLVSVVLAASTPIMAEDIDLFLGLPAASVGAPNILFIVDNTANWNTPFDAEMLALQQVFASLPEGEVNVGVMMFTETGGGNSNVDGGYVRAAIRSMTAANKSLYGAMIGNLDKGDDKSNGGKAGVTVAEAYHYFAGLDARSGKNKIKTDYTGNPDGVRTIGNGGNAVTVSADHDIYSLSGNALASKGGPTYNSPVGLGCAKNFIIWVGNGAAQDNSSDGTTASNMLAALGGDTSQISISPSGSADNMADEWARFMRDSSLGITLFTLDINTSTNGQGPGWTALLKSMAAQSDGKYYDVDGTTADIVAALNDALSRILAVNSVFSSVALPASANTQSTFLNQVYIGLFRPDASADPRWHGNLKHYKLGFVNEGSKNLLKVLDADGAAIVDPGTGFIAECARSYWTPASADTYWDYLLDPRGQCLTVANSAVSNFPDGPVVEKGGQGYKTRAANPATRAVKTCNPALASCTSMVDFNLANTDVSQTALGAASATERDTLIEWAIGYDHDDENNNGITNEIRPSIHGDIVHSQPVAIDYAADPLSPEVVVFYGGNDGMLRAINGNRSTTHNGVGAGEEFWTYVAPEFYGKIKRLRDNSPVMKFPATGTGAGATGQVKDYGADGPLSAYTGTVGGTDKQLVFAGLRRAGRTLTAFDVTDINNPDILWKRGCPNLGNDTSCSSGWENLGQTWSKAQITQAEGHTNPLLVMGGGYDDCEDYDNNSGVNHNCASGTKGDSIFIIDAITGAILKEFTATTAGVDLPRAFAGNITLVPVSDANLDLMFAYATDTGGNIYRISGGTDAAPAGIGTTAPSSWILTQVAKLGCGPKANSTCTNPRKFLYGPDVVRSEIANRFTLLVGSGDREKPLYDYGASGAVQNYFFAVVDEATNGNWTDDPTPPECNGDVICMDSLTSVTTAGGVVPGDRGWKMALTSREQVVSAALVVADVVNFSTHIPVAPNPTSCESSLGQAQVYNVNFEDGEGEKINLIAGGLVPTPVAGKVILDSGQIVPFCIGCGGEGSAIGSSEVTSGVSWTQPVSRVSWEVEE